MAGANGPTSVGGTTDTPNPDGGATEKPASTEAGDAARKDKAKETPPGDRNEGG